MKIFDLKRLLRYFREGREWEIIIVAFLVLLVFLITANCYVFLNLEEEIAKPISSEIKPQTLKRELLIKISDDFKEKEKQLNQDILIKPGISDPSL